MSLVIFTFKKLRIKKDEKFSFYFGGLSCEEKNNFTKIFDYLSCKLEAFPTKLLF